MSGKPQISTTQHFTIGTTTCSIVPKQCSTATGSPALRDGQIICKLMLKRPRGKKENFFLSCFLTIGEFMQEPAGLSFLFLKSDRDWFLAHKLFVFLTFSSLTSKNRLPRSYCNVTALNKARLSNRKQCMEPYRCPPETRKIGTRKIFGF